VSSHAGSTSGRKEGFGSQEFSKRKRFVLGMVLAMERSRGAWSDVGRTREVRVVLG